MDLEKDEFEQELEAQNEGKEFTLEYQQEETLDKSQIKRVSKIPHMKYDLKVDLDKKEVKFYIYLPKIKLEEATDSEKKKGYKQREVVEFNSILVFKKNYIPEKDSIIIDDKTYKIPEFFNAELIAKNDLSTWERLFYDVLSNEIRIELDKYRKK